MKWYTIFKRFVDLFWGNWANMTQKCAFIPYFMTICGYSRSI